MRPFRISDTRCFFYLLQFNGNKLSDGHYGVAVTLLLLYKI